MLNSTLWRKPCQQNNDHLKRTKYSSPSPPPPVSAVLLSAFPVTLVNHRPEADGPPSDISLEDNSCLTLYHSAYVMHLTSSPRVGISSSHTITDEKQ